MNHFRKPNRRRPSTRSVLQTKAGAQQRRRLFLRRIASLVLILAGLVSIAGGGYYVGTRLALPFLSTDSRFALQEVVLEGTERLPRKEILAASGLRLGQNLLSISLPEVYKAVSSLPYVQRASVRRELPNRIEITIEERVPLAKVWTKAKRFSGQSLCVDFQGVVFVARRGEVVALLPELEGVPSDDLEIGNRLHTPECRAALHLLRLLQGTPSLRNLLDPASLDVSGHLCLRVVTRDGVGIVLRLDHLERQMKRLQKIYVFSQSRGRKVASVDLTPEQNVPVIFEY
ncbi:cell division protein FtsQ/DivIB [Methylacidimicrobium sp. B4]|uniref:cell division protein FtsQ/DivIB n=1 Tax=Methylacidimicrobium sp. B4 TaxID=2796139 RepID=UPI001A8CACF7|nr:FtsQ-type POTRA domain-containing protein [Methylacidimicrobium sp. B4]QSR84499.1 FtsQ-type POTRA domain-containing protein [Methylacidimicrobium sp. B4]